MSRRLFILGSTGSIGTNSLQVVKHLQSKDGIDAWKVVGLAAGNNRELLQEQAETFNVEAVSSNFELTQQSYATYNSPTELLKQHAQHGDLVVAAIVGFAGIEPVIAAIEMGCDIALANKESLVAAGHLITNLAAEANVKIIPIDSEHSAIFQSIQNTPINEVRKITLTASGGSLRELPNHEIHEATVEQVLNHPTWNMGAKVTVDTASLMNKALELIEAHWLFNVGSTQLEAVIHPQSIVHGMVEFVDGSTIAQLSPPDMKFPIQYALTFPHRSASPYKKMDWTSLQNLEFIPIDLERFPAIELAFEVIDASGTAGTILNAANEVVVEAFLQRNLPFGSMLDIVKEVLSQVPSQTELTYLDLVNVDQSARKLASELISTVVKSN